MALISKLSKRERIIFYITVAFVALVLIDRFILTPMLTKLSKIEGNITTTKNDLVTDRAIIKNKLKIEADHLLYQEYFKKGNDAEEMATLQKTIEELVNRAGITAIDLKPVKEKGKPYYTANLESKGLMKQFVTFLYEMNESRSLLRVEKIDIGPEAPESNSLKAYIAISKTVASD